MRNRGELAEGWYDPETKRKADESAHRPDMSRGRASNYEDTEELDDQERRDESEDDIFGPPLPGKPDTRRAAGPVIPSVQDLELRRGKRSVCLPL